MCISSPGDRRPSSSPQNEFDGSWKAKPEDPPQGKPPGSFPCPFNDGGIAFGVWHAKQIISDTDSQANSLWRYPIITRRNLANAVAMQTIAPFRNATTVKSHLVQTSSTTMTRARRIAVNIAKLPEPLRKD
jgi:hypothetical protein